MPTSAFPKTVELKDGRSVELRLLARDDFEQLHAFFRCLPDEDRLFLRHDVRDPELVRRWTQELDLARVIPVAAWDGDHVVASGSLHQMTHGWMQHVGHIRLITGRSHRNQGLGGLIAREMVTLAAKRNLEKLQAHVVEDNVGAIKMFEAVGFKTVAILDGMVKDQSGRSRNLAIMVNDVSALDRILEDWIQEAILPGYRAPGAGA